MSPRTWRDWAAPVCAVGLSALFWDVFSLRSMVVGYGPGLGVLVFVVAYYAVLFLLLGPRWDAGGIFLMVVSVCLSLCCTLYAYTGFKLLNCFVILVTSAIATFRLSGQLRAEALAFRAIPQTAGLTLNALFSRIAPPLKRLRGGEKEKAGRIVLAVLFSVLILAVVLALLASADMVFGSFFKGIAEWLEELSPFQTIWRIILIIVLALLVSSGLYYIRFEPVKEPVQKQEKERQVLPFLMPAVLLDAVYIVFCAIQIRFLFGGASAAAMAGGWAAYAREGFFQLVAVAAINLTLCVAGTDEKRFSKKGGLVLRIVNGLMLVLTVVILASAARRMQLYILAFGLSILRLMTLWGMVVIAVGILAAGWKLLRTGFEFFPVFAGFALASWCILCLCNPAGCTASYNVDAYLSGRLKTVDTEYLWELAPDGDAALRKLAAEDPRYQKEVDDIFYRSEHYFDDSRWSTWTASAD